MAKSPFNDIFEVAKAQDGKVKQTIKDLVQVVRNEIKLLPHKGLYFSNKLKGYLDQKLHEDNNELISFYYDMYFQVLVAESRWSLDSYFQALEWNRPLEEQFYLPRRKQLLEIVKDLEDLFIWNVYSEYFLSLPPRVGKLLADSTPILTTKGWKKHGDLVVGDVLFNPNGTTTKVIAVHPKNHTTHTVKFSDGTEIKCHFRHEWQVYDRAIKKVKTVETQELLKGKIRYGEHFRYLLMPNEIVKGVEQELPVKPYTFGAWLGDGSNMQPKITGDKKDYAIIEGIQNDGYALIHTYEHKKTKVMSYVFDNLRHDLRKLNLCFAHHRKEKHIPYQYLVAPIQDRLELLAGLLDTDGCLIKKENRYSFSTCDKALADDVVSLIRTFGWRTSVKKEKPRLSSSGIQGRKTTFVISFNPTIHIPCRLQRKQLFTFSKQRRIAIVDIVEQTLEEQEQGNCITVEQDGMYLAGNTLTPTHNTTLTVYTMSWLIGVNSEKSNLYVSAGEKQVGAFYNGVAEILNDETMYLWKQIFPNAVWDKDTMANAKDTQLDIGRKKRYHSLTCRSIDSKALNGACDCNGALIADDLCSDIEVALNKDRLSMLNYKVRNNMLSRAKMGAKILWIGTRWSLLDPIGVRIESLENTHRKYKVMARPALNEQGESNFDYLFGVGYDTEHYLDIKQAFIDKDDEASWEAMYMQSPVERSGRLFTKETTRFYNGILPSGKPDRILAFGDIAWGGGDCTAFPVVYKYGKAYYVPEIICDPSDKKITQPRVANMIVKHEITAVRFEKNNGGGEYKDDVEKLLLEKDYRCNMTVTNADNTTQKEYRIFDKAPEIRDMFFLEPAKQDKDYRRAMEQMFGFSMLKKKQHEDILDALVGVLDMDREIKREVVFEIFERAF